MKCIHSKKLQSGQAMVEHIIIWPIVLMLTLGTFQISLLYRAKSTLDEATFRAAREGSLNNAFKDPMRRKLAEAMAPLELKRNPGIVGYGLALGKSYLLNYNGPLGGANRGGGRIDIVSPTQGIFTSFARNSYQLVSCPNRNAVCPANSSLGESRRRIRQIPNDNLNVRRASTVNLSSGGQTINLNLQDANLLKIRSHWCYGLEVPFVNRLIYQTVMNLTAPGPHTSACRIKTNALQAAGTTGAYFVPISSDSIVRMQSPVRCDTDVNNPDYNNCRNFQI